MKRNIFLVIFCVFAASVFYYFGRQNRPTLPPVTKEDKEPNEEATPQPVTPEPNPTAPAPETTTAPTATPSISLTEKMKNQKVESDGSQAMNEYLKIKESVLETIPLKSDLPKEKKLVHNHVPQSVFEASKKLGNFKQQIMMYPGHKGIQEDAKTFYQDCAANDDFPNSVRSLCLYNRFTMAKDQGETFDLSPYPEEISKIIMRRGQRTRRKKNP